ncbi:MAG: thermostable hemolysin [Neptuniibacter sp.]
MHQLLIQKNALPQAATDVLLVSDIANQKQVKQFAQQRFKAAYGADIKDFLPNMIALVDSNNRLQASAGFQSAAATSLYLEHYLDKPIEATIADRLNVSIPRRNEILEVGNLASLSAGATRRLILNLACYFQSQGFKWLVITATPQVKHSFEKLNVGLNLHSICPASLDAVSTSETNWGNYYDHDPEVYVGDIDSGICALRNNPLFRKLLSRIHVPVVDTNIKVSVEEACA